MDGPLVYLSLETVVNGHSVLIFCPTKNWCEKVADTVAKEFFNLGKPSKVPDKNDRVRKYFFFLGIDFKSQLFVAVGISILKCSRSD